jgi:hypothetical protein
MKTTRLPNSIEFYHHQPKNLLRIERDADGLVVRAACNNFSEKRKSFFIRELAAEGFIPDHYRWSSESDAGGLPGVRWIVDASWVCVPAAVQRQAERRCVKIFLIAGLSWLLVMGAIFILAGQGPGF